MNKPILKTVKSSANTVMLIEFYKTPLNAIEISWTKHEKLPPDFSQITKFYKVITPDNRNQLMGQLMRLFELQFGENRIE